MGAGRSGIPVPPSSRRRATARSISTSVPTAIRSSPASRSCSTGPAGWSDSAGSTTSPTSPRLPNPRLRTPSVLPTAPSPGSTRPGREPFVYPQGDPMPFLPVGGQAVIEGVMMRSPSRVAIAVRRLDGSIVFKERPFVSVTRRFKLLGLPVVRGAVSLFETLSLGIGALNFSADQATHDETQPKGIAADALPATAAAGA